MKGKKEATKKGKRKSKDRKKYKENIKREGQMMKGKAEGKRE